MVDPDELEDLTVDPESHHKLSGLDGILHEMLNPDVVDTTAKADQGFRLLMAEQLGQEEFDAQVEAKCAFD